MSDRNNLFPVFLKLEMLETLIVGGGNVGLEKLEALLKNSPAAKITLIGREIRNEIKSLAAQHSSIKLIERNFRLWDAWDKDIIILATDDKKLHESIRAFTRPRNVLINVADTPDLCDFYLGAVVTKGNLKIGISTNGKSPTIAKRMREYLEDALPEDTNALLDNMQKIRDQIKGDFNQKIKVLNEVTGTWLNNKK
ncbi:MAG TPA: bifunctional precorrin-2 dehydrogenase/sirohydrochlorin ferrochelatase [Cyclobacteriaceae bacterium]|nr:bifunctional precorrin-2 dehydrogenase/sirohydrochlorin ferrochelatase [Cyclobacteriaceae bacterium]